MNTPEPDPPDRQAMIEHLRELRATQQHWYRTAETKAQLVLTVDGLFLTFLTTSVITKRDDVVRTTATFGPETWLFLAGMALALALSIYSSVICLASRGMRRKHLRDVLEHHHVDPGKAHTYPPEVTMFFYYLGSLPAGQYAERMLTAGPEFIIRALANDIISSSGPIIAKHRWINRAFTLTGITLGFFLFTGVSYVLRIQGATSTP